MSDIFDNYIKLCLLIRGPATQAFRALMTCYLQKCCLTFREFIDINQHEIYHLYTERRCCQCTGQSFFRDKTLLQMSQIEKMFDTSPQTTSKRKDNHDYRKKDMCCCFANCQLCVDDVDITLLRILLNKFCNIFFWTCYLDIEHSGSFQQFLKNKRHELFHLWKPKITCCKCNEHKNTYKRSKISEINQHEFESLYTIDRTITAVECTLNDTCTCTYSARQGISLIDIKGTKIFKTITDCFCSPQKEINSIVETRNNFSHSTDITEEEFKKCWSTLRDNIKKIETMTESKLWTEESIDKLEQKLDLKNLFQEIKTCTDLGKSILNGKLSHEILDQMKRELKNLFQKSRENNPALSFTSLSHKNYTEASICLHPKQLKLKLLKLYKGNDCGTEEAEKRLKENCRNLNLTLRNETPRDGNCFFDAVSSQLRDHGLRERSAEEIRENVIDYLMENKTFQGVDGDVNIEHFIDHSTFEDWASNMRRNGVFADHVVVLGMARMLETNMLIVTSNPQASHENCVTHIIGKMKYRGMTIKLGHVWENHYYSLMDATRENRRLVECCKMHSLNHRHSPLGICKTALKKVKLDAPPSNYEVTSVDIYMTLKDRTITREMKIKGKGEVFAPDVREIEIPCSSSISPMSYDNGDGDSDCDDDLFVCGKCGKRFTTYESFEKHKKESIQCNPRKRKKIKKLTDTLGMSSEQKQNMTPGEPNEKRLRLKIRMQQKPGEMEPVWKQYVKQVQKTCTGNLDVGEEFIVEYIEEGSLVFWTKTNSSTIKNKAKFAKIMDRFMVNLFQKCPIDTKDATKFSFSVDVVEAAEDEDTDDEDENDVFICGRCGITFKSFSSFTSHKRNIDLCCKRKRTDQQHKNKKIDVEKCLPFATTPVVEEVGQAAEKRDTVDLPTEFVMEVSGMKPTTSEDTLRHYFESRKVANADVVKMKYIKEKKMYMVWFEDESAIEAVMSKNLRVDGKTLKAKRYVPPTPQKTVPKHDDKVFKTNIRPTTTEDRLKNFLEVKSNCILKESIFGEAEGTALVTFDQPPGKIE
ncbi:uncharacterized protein [Mytilus edulis]|uniref:uncharacterized protein n=1 Tax=Mytilus edulis TaxID=6550 RepID=UPI0039EF39FF